ncbi:MAG TPA: hypothetical protein VH082_14950 [Rudaea sp.]|nr:hypothetical protein [Rudaea sp.]
MTKKLAPTRRKATVRRASRNRTAVQHAQDIALLSPTVAARRLWDLRSASPFAVGVAMNRFALEKTLAFSSTWLAASVAAFSAQLRFLQPGSRGSTLGAANEAANEMESFARKTLRPIASRVRRNSRA